MTPRPIQWGYVIEGTMSVLVGEKWALKEDDPSQALFVRFPPAG